MSRSIALVALAGAASCAHAILAAAQLDALSSRAGGPLPEAPPHAARRPGPAAATLPPPGPGLRLLLNGALALAAPLRAWADAPAGAAAPPPLPTPLQRATFTALAGPLMYLLRGELPEPVALQAALRQAAQRPAALQPCELSSLLWSAAYLGAPPGLEAEMRRLAAHVGASLARLPLHDAIACTWALLTAGLAPHGLFGQLAALYMGAGEAQLDEAAVVYMLQCCMWQLEAEAPAAAGGGAQLAPSKQELEALLLRHSLGGAHR
jgi:hypothetical protein